MDNNKYKQLCKMGSVTLRGMEVYLTEMLSRDILSKESTVEDLLILCKQFSKWEREQYDNSKLEQGYCCHKHIPLE